MKLIQVFDDPALKLPLYDPEVYYSENRKYKIIVSHPLTDIGHPGTKLITISRHPLTDKRPAPSVCAAIVKALNLSLAVDIAKALTDDPELEPGIIRLLTDKDCERIIFV